MSFTPRSRLSRDSHRSPSVAASAAANPNSAFWPRLRLSHGEISPTNTTAASTDAIQPPASPSNVLFGLACDIGRVPRLRPTKKPPTRSEEHTSELQSHV